MFSRALFSCLCRTSMVREVKHLRCAALSSATVKRVQTKIYVGNLPYNVDNDDLLEVFSKYAESDITDVYIAKDKATGRPRGFGFVEFRNSEDAQAAINSANGQEVKGMAIRCNIAWPKPSVPGDQDMEKVLSSATVKRVQNKIARPKPSASGDQDTEKALFSATVKRHQNKIFVGNLSHNVDNDDLLEVFAKYAESDIIDVYIPKDKATGRPRGFGFVEFRNSEDAQAAVNSANGQEVKGMAIHCNLAQQKPSVPGDQDTEKVYVGNLSRDVNENDLLEFFEKYAESDINDVFIPRDRGTGKSRGYGFVTFKNKEDAQAAVDGAYGQAIKGTTIRCEHENKSHLSALQRDSKVKVYVRNLSNEVNEDDLTEFFQKYTDSVIMDTYISRDRETGKPRGFGFVTFNNREDAEAAVNAANGQKMKGISIPCYI